MILRGRYYPTDGKRHGQRVVMVRAAVWDRPQLPFCNYPSLSKVYATKINRELLPPNRPPTSVSLKLRVMR